ncbi:TetR/AcrR family transcriptional regulator [Dermatobacter hominis]|uniref:TetR/AcrR family transcriptional regulator n=1 Tax=Dermatobacter hominis TaxID=2884263 RepID=UPI001D103113|nr:TetR family transcriptional regulator [Dermatobacter hominis]UDY34525.1 TetR/AcrR family transcriptional regulator [Dermatobacter hominis]
MTPSDTTSPEVERTRHQILEAAGEIISTEEFDALSMRRVATTAGVSLSTVIRHFGTKDALLAALVAHGDDDVERVDKRRQIDQGDIGAAVGVVVDDYEEAGDQLLHMLAQEHRFPALATLLDVGRRGHREWVRWAFAPQLRLRTGARRTQLEDLLVVGTDVYTWKLLRRDRGHSAKATTAAMTALCEAVAS